VTVKQGNQALSGLIIDPPLKETGKKQGSGRGAEQKQSPVRTKIQFQKEGSREGKKGRNSNLLLKKRPEEEMLLSQRLRDLSP